MSEPFIMSLDELQPSQLYISEAKLARVEEKDGAQGPLPVKRLAGRVVLTDGHTRALAAWRAGRRQIEVYWDLDELDWEAYEICVTWCAAAGIRTVADLAGRVVPPEEYEVVWLQRCARMQQALAQWRAGESSTDPRDTMTDQNARQVEDFGIPNLFGAGTTGDRKPEQVQDSE